MGFFINPPAVSSEVLQNISCESETMPRSGQQQATKCEEKAAASFVVFIHATVLSFLPLMVHFGKKKDSLSAAAAKVSREEEEEEEGNESSRSRN